MVSTSFPPVGTLGDVPHGLSRYANVWLYPYGCHVA
jgi:hypothetical protein